MFLSKYGAARHIYVPLVKRGVVDLAISADFTPQAGDVKISKDGGAAANVTNLPTAITMGNTAVWDFHLTATEMQAAQVVVTVADSATKAVEDQTFVIETYGHASALIEVDLDQANLPAAVNSIAAGAITASAIATDAIDADAIADGAINAGAIADGAITAAKIATDAIDADALADGAITAATFAAGAIDAAAIATDAITAAKIAADAIGSAELAASAVAEIADGVWDEVLSGHLTAGSTGAGLNAAGSAGDPWATALPGAYGAGSAGKIVGDNLNATVGSRATPAEVATALNTYDAPTNAEMEARTLAAAAYATAANQTTILNRIGAFTGSGLNTVLGFLRAIAAKAASLTPSDLSSGTTYDNTTDSLEALKDSGLPTTTSIPTAGAIADAVWDEAVSGHVASGSTGEALRLARAQAAGKWTIVGDTFTLYDTDGTTVLEVFTLAPSGGPFTSRTPT